MRPHIITRRYAEFSAAIAGLNESFPDQRIENILDELSAEVELCVSRMASIFRDPQSKLIFLINNYDMLLVTCFRYTYRFILNIHRNLH